MDDKASRRNGEDGNSRRQKQMRIDGRKVWKFLRDKKNILLASVLLLAIVALLFGIFSQFQPPATDFTPSGETAIDYSTFVKQVEAGNVLAVTVRGNDINGLLAYPLAQARNASATQPVARPSEKSVNTDYQAWNRYIGNGNPTWSTTTAEPSLDPDRAIYTRAHVEGDAGLMPLLVGHHVLVNSIPLGQNSAWVALLWKVVPAVIVIVLLLIFLAARNNGARGGRSLDNRISQLGRSRARRMERVKESNPLHPVERKTPSQLARPGQAGSSYKPRQSTEPPVTFADVAGIDEVRTEVEEIVQFLRSPERFDRLGAHIPRGALLVGSPGTGKTLLARAVAGEANVPFFSISASEFVEMFVGVGASRVRDLFNQARKAAPCVVFIDEIDAVGRKRAMRATNNDERDQTLNQLLVELDGFDSRKAVVVMAATNRVDILDKALLRPGRFDRRITVSAPDRVGREAILKVHTRKTPLHEEISLERLARMTTGMTGADLANLVNEAALSAARRELEHVTYECFEEALARVQLGALRPLIMSEKERQIIAFHEGGHALVAYHLPEADTVNRVTILPRGQSLGVTQFIAEEDRYNYSRQSLMARIAVGLGGRVAEELTFGTDQVTTGAENDLQVVTDLARRMVTRWGMSEQVGVVFADYQAEGDYSLNMRGLRPDEMPAQAQSLVLDADGNYRLNGVPTNRHPYTHAMAVAATRSHTSSSGTMSSLIDAEVQRILNEGRAIAREILTQHNQQLTSLAKTLMEEEQLNREQFEQLLDA
ncbi:ATP-dependent metallopeptidase FtsH/Yme1/Tma family protein [Ktedonosporobacter rubrisoli]|uniref:ATP-dependent zinc metalloprotease FtsH n=1 Tax=Ktedonosporobacter rubrisoli TaxID=2509675 RepID=A0A4P6K210_KTERU|nr:ATP-dependent zinc metalloprotease FtsH [Ktedonosporobacter rubrisoli]QBD82218.1 ATP-dependent metallopeptidase FtsH/Yme1/Tma family protein [Ktedonosporobacter rubrisoli]